MSVGSELQRVSVVGTSGCGKTTFAAELAAALDSQHVQLDALYWLPEWQERPVDEFRALVEEAAAQSNWVIDGNYTKSRDLVWARATHVVWLNYSFPRVFFQSLRRTLRRVWTQEELYAGNRESWRKTFFSHDSILMWVLITFRANRRKYSAMRDAPEWAQIDFIELRSPSEARRLLTGLGPIGAEESRQSFRATSES